MRKFLHKCIRKNDGVALLEFALVFPLIMILLLFTLEFSRYFLIHLKVQKTAYAMANIITSTTPASGTPATGNQFSQDEILTTLGGQQLQKMLSPYDDDGNAMMIVSSVRNEVTTYSQKGLVVKWQVCSNGASGCGATSIVTQAGVPGFAGFVKNTQANFSAPYSDFLGTMLDGENMIVVEITYPYTPLYTSLFAGLNKVFPSFSFPGLTPRTVSHAAFFAPRNAGANNGGLDCLPPSAADAPNAYFSYQDCPCSTPVYASGCDNLPQ